MPSVQVVQHESFRVGRPEELGDRPRGESVGADRGRGRAGQRASSRGRSSRCRARTRGRPLSIRRQNIFVDRSSGIRAGPPDKVVRPIRRAPCGSGTGAIHADIRPQAVTPTPAAPLLHYTLPLFLAVSREVPPLRRNGAAEASLARAQPGRDRALPAARMALLPHVRAASGFLDGRHGFVLCALQAYGVFLKWAKVWEWQRYKANGWASIFRPTTRARSTRKGQTRRETGSLIRSFRISNRHRALLAVAPRPDAFPAEPRRAERQRLLSRRHSSFERAMSRPRPPFLRKLIAHIRQCRLQRAATSKNASRGRRPRAGLPLRSAGDSREHETSGRDEGIWSGRAALSVLAGGAPGGRLREPRLVARRCSVDHPFGGGAIDFRRGRGRESADGVVRCFLMTCRSFVSRAAIARRLLAVVRMRFSADLMLAIGCETSLLWGQWPSTPRLVSRCLARRASSEPGYSWITYCRATTASGRRLSS